MHFNYQGCNQLIFSGPRQNNCSLLLYLATEHVFEEFRAGQLSGYNS